jgi:hypothetical protein
MKMAEDIGADGPGIEKNSRRKRRLPLIAGALACASMLAASAGESAVRAPQINCLKDTSYAGEMWQQSETGVSATITETQEPLVRDGHVAAWIGIGGSGSGPNGEDEWLQVGIAEGKVLTTEIAGADTTKVFVMAEHQIYYEVGTGQMPRYVPLGAVAIGQPVRFTLKEMKTAPNYWKIFVDGKQKGPALLLRGSHGDNAFSPTVLTESWGGMSEQCNDFNFEFSDITLTGPDSKRMYNPSGVRLYRDPGYRLSNFAVRHFTALNK